MPAKTVQVEIKQGSGFKTECRAGKHLVVIDQPAPAGGTDAGPTPLDVQLMVLGGCLAAIGRIIANQRKLVMRGIEVTVEGEIDTDGLLGKRQSRAPRRTHDDIGLSQTAASQARPDSLQCSVKSV